MREKGSFSAKSYASTAALVASVGRGSATYVGEERVRQGKGLDPLVDPKGLEKYGPVRGSGNLLVPEGDAFVLKFGVAMPSATDCDLTGSMGNNVSIFFKVQPRLQKLLNDPKTGVLRRYQVQMSTGAIQDRVDQFAYQRSQFEPDNEVERQMGLLFPERGGGDSTEDYQLSMFAAAYLTKTSITEYGLRGYYFPVGDVWGREKLDRALLERVFGPKVLELAFGKNPPNSLPSAKEVAKQMLQNWHAFFLQVGNDGYSKTWWSGVLGEERFVRLPRTESLAEVQAVIIGLTEGVLDLQTSVDFLREAKVSADDAKKIVNACAGVPTGLQAKSPNFNKIPMAGAKFASREDIWPIGTKDAAPASKPVKGKKPAPKEKKKESWKV